MKDAVSLKKDYSIKLESYMKSFLNPRYVFLPIDDGFKLRVIDNSYVYKNDIVMFTKDGKSVHSSVSGRVLGVKEMFYSSGEKKSSLVIENDFKENIRIRKCAKKFIQRYDKENFMQVLEDTSLYYKGKYVHDKFCKVNRNFLVNAIELEPYFGNKYFILKENAETILETIDLISELFQFEKIVLAIKNNDSEIINSFFDLIGTYPNIEIRLLADGYPCGKDEFLKRELELEDVFILSVDEIIGIYNVLKKQAPVTEKIITITGNAVKPKCAIKVKLGTLLSEVFINNFDFTKENVDVYLNGMMSGKNVSTLKYVIDSDVDGILIMEKTHKQEGDCINCGLCTKNCPMGLNPKYVFDHEGKVKPEYKENCLACGLCSYMCPSNRDLKKYMNLGDIDE